MTGDEVPFALNSMAFSFENSTVMPASISPSTLPCGATVPEAFVVIDTAPLEVYSKSDLVGSFSILKSILKLARLDIFV